MTGLESLGDTLLSTAVSNSVVAAGIAILAIAATRRRLNPSIVHCLWVLVLIKLVTPPLFEVQVPVPDFGAASVAESPPVDDSSAGPLDLTGMFDNRSAGRPAASPIEAFPIEARIPRRATTDAASPLQPGRDLLPEMPSWSTLVLLTWALGAITALAAGLYRAARFHRSLRYSRAASGDVRREAQQLSRRLGLQRTPAIRVLPGKLSPMLWGFLGPAQVLLPEVLEKNLTADQRRTLLAHELAHLHRRDHWVRVLELIVRAIHWWNPLVFWACRHLRNAEEECCDAWVVWALPEASRSYADALLDTVEFLSDAPDMPAHASGIGKVNNLKRRLIMIMQGDNRRTPGHLGRAAILGLATLTLPLVPALGQVEQTDRRRQSETMNENQDPNQAMNKRAVVSALRRAVAMMADSDHGKEAAVLRNLLQKIQRTRSANLTSGTLGRSLATTNSQQSDVRSRIQSLTDQADIAHAEGNTEKARRLQQQVQQLRAQANELRAESQQFMARARLLRDRETAQQNSTLAGQNRQRARDQARIARDREVAETRRRSQTERDYSDARELYRALATRARDRARDSDNRDRAEAIRREYTDRRLDRNDTGDDRVRQLEEKVQRLTNAVERLLRANDQDPRGRSRGREDREIEEMEEAEEIEEEEIEEEVEEEIEVKEVEEIEEAVEIEARKAKKKGAKNVEVEEITEEEVIEKAKAGKGRRVDPRRSRRGRKTAAEPPTVREAGRDLITRGR